MNALDIQNLTKTYPGFTLDNLNLTLPSGCVMGGGQPVHGTKVQRSQARTAGLYAADGELAIKKPNENPLMDVFYNGYFKGKAHELLHNHE